jgi:hypothetical protein
MWRRRRDAIFTSTAGATLLSAFSTRTDRLGMLLADMVERAVDDLLGTDFLPLCITMLMKRAMTGLPCLGSGNRMRVGV